MEDKQVQKLEVLVDQESDFYIYQQITSTFIEVCNKSKEGKEADNCPKIQK